jgi:hypothetical protein
VVLDGIEGFRKCPRAIIKYHVCGGVLIKSVIWKNTTGVLRHELWVDPTGSSTQWQFMGTNDEPQWGVRNDLTNVITKKGGPQQVEFRNDCKG